MPQTQQIHFKDFPLDGVLYRVDFIGHVRRGPRGGSNNPLIDVLLSPIKKPSRKFKEIISQANVNPDEQRICSVSVGELIALEAGSVWCDREVAWSPGRSDEEVLELDISDENVQLISANDVVDMDGNRQPLFYKNYYKLGKAYNSNILAIKYGDDPYGVLIPVMEIVKFYYLGSSKYSRAVFSGLLDDLDKIINLDELSWDPATKLVYLKLRQDFKNIDAWLIARLMKSEVALRNARRIFRSIQKSFVNNPYYQYTSPETGLPFWGRTKLRVLLKKVKYGDGENDWRRLVLAIRNCTHPFPYDDVCADRDNSNLKGLFDEDEDREGKDVAFPNAIKGATENTSEDVNLDPFVDADGTSQPQEISIPTQRFSYLMGKKLIPPVKMETHYKSDEFVSLIPPKEHEGDSTGPDGFGHDTGNPVTLKPDDITPRPNTQDIIHPGFDDFIGLTECLECMKEIHNISYLTINNDDNRFNYKGHNVSIFPTRQPVNNNKKIGWAIVGADKKQRPRMAFLAEVSSRWGTAYLLEIEPNNDSTALYLFSSLKAVPVGEYSLEDILFRFATKGINRKKIKQVFMQYKHRSIHHKAKSPEAFALRVLDGIKHVCC